MTIPKKKWLSLIGVVVFAYLLRKIGVRRVLDCVNLVEARYLWVSALFIGPVAALQCLRWKLLLDGQGIKLTFLRALQFHFAGQFYGVATPGRLGTFVRGYLVQQATGVGLGRAMANIVFDRLMGLAALSLLAVVGAGLVLSRWWRPGLGLALVAAASALAAGLLLLHPKVRASARVRLTLILPGRARRWLDAQDGRLGTYAPSCPYLVCAFFVALLAWVCIYAQVYVIAMGLGFRMPFSHFATVVPISNIVGYLPITISGFGTRDGALVYLFGLYGASPELALTQSLLGYALSAILPSLCGLPVVLWLSVCGSWSLAPETATAKRGLDSVLGGPPRQPGHRDVRAAT